MEYRIQTLSQLKPLLQGFRKKAGLTQADMAEQLGMSQQGYAQIESNLATTSVERLYTILRLLNVDLHLAAPSTASAANGNSVGDRRAEVSRSLPNLGNQAGTEATLRKGRPASRLEPKNKEIAPSVEKKRAGTGAGKAAPTAQTTPKKLVKRSDTSRW